MSDIKINIVRTAKDKIFDIVFLVLTLTIWGIIIWLISRAPDIVPTHFGPSGKPDHYGSPTFIIIPSVIMTIVAFICAFSIYFPGGSVNLPFHNGPGNARQKRLGVLLCRIIAIMMLGIIFVSDIPGRVIRLIFQRDGTWKLCLKYFTLLFLFVLSIFRIVAGTYNPFIYFQF